ncbi:MAG: hypothetical protein ACXAEU_24870 [Candidatus Hodarchaeales archaeon]|jgi:multimeric flavodoxin WrbA
MSSNKQALVLVGSPRGKKSTSTALGNYLMELQKEKGLETDILWIRAVLRSEETIKQMLEAVDKADIITLAVPLYDDTAPYIVIKTMEMITEHRKTSVTAGMSGSKLFNVIVNCGFFEKEHNLTVLPVYRKFATTVNFDWAGSFIIGAGEGLGGKEGKTLDEAGAMATNTKKVLEEIAEAHAKGISFPDMAINIVPGWFPYRLMRWLNSRGWEKTVKDRGENIFAQPYKP